VDQMPPSGKGCDDADRHDREHRDNEGALRPPRHLERVRSAAGPRLLDRPVRGTYDRVRRISCVRRR